MTLTNYFWKNHAPMENKRILSEKINLLKLSTFNLQPSTFNLQPSTFNLQPSTFNLYWLL